MSKVIKAITPDGEEHCLLTVNETEMPITGDFIVMEDKQYIVAKRVFTWGSSSGWVVYLEQSDGEA